jgi:hypothetical protein
VPNVEDQKHVDQAEALAVPPDERLRLDDREEATPLNDPGEHNEGDVRRVVGPSWLRLTRQRTTPTACFSTEVSEDDDVGALLLYSSLREHHGIGQSAN